MNGKNELATKPYECCCCTREEPRKVIYPFIRVNADVDNLTDANLYCPSNRILSPTKPFNPFYYVQDLVKDYAAYGEEIKYDKGNHNYIARNYTLNNIMNNITIVLEDGLMYHLKHVIYADRQEKFEQEYFYMMQKINNMVDHCLSMFDQQLSVSIIPSLVFMISNNLSLDLCEFLRTMIYLGCINVHLINNEINDTIPEYDTNNIRIPKEYIDSDVSMIISYFTYTINKDVQKISELVEIGIMDGMAFKADTNKLYDQYNKNLGNSQLKELMGINILDDSNCNHN